MIKSNSKLRINLTRTGMIGTRKALIIVTIFSLMSCGQKGIQERKADDLQAKSSVTSDPYDYRINYPEIKSVEPTLQRFSLPEHIAWVAIMDSLYEKDLSGIKDSVLVNDVNTYDPVGMGWSDSYGIDSIFASSVLAAQGKVSYDPQKVIDNKTTAWVEGMPDHGVGETISIRYPKLEREEPINSITIFNGFQKSESLYKKNSRVKTLRLLVNGIPAYDLQLADTMKGQSFSIDIVPGDHLPLIITLQIMAVYPGDQYTDTAITEIQFDGIWRGI